MDWCFDKRIKFQIFNCLLVCTSLKRLLYSILVMVLTQNPKCNSREGQIHWGHSDLSIPYSITVRVWCQTAILPSSKALWLYWLLECACTIIISHKLDYKHFSKRQTHPSKVCMFTVSFIQLLYYKSWQNVQQMNNFKLLDLTLHVNHST